MNILLIYIFLCFFFFLLFRAHFNAHKFHPLNVNKKFRLQNNEIKKIKIIKTMNSKHCCCCLALNFIIIEFFIDLYLFFISRCSVGVEVDVCWRKEEDA